MMSPRRIRRRRALGFGASAGCRIPSRPMVITLARRVPASPRVKSTPATVSVAVRNRSYIIREGSGFFDLRWPYFRVHYFCKGNSRGSKVNPNKAGVIPSITMSAKSRHTSSRPSVGGFCFSLTRKAFCFCCFLLCCMRPRLVVQSLGETCQVSPTIYPVTYRDHNCQCKLPNRIGRQDAHSKHRS